MLVVQHDKVDKKVVKRNLATLRKSTPNVFGAVLNAVDMKARGHYYYYYPKKKKDAAFAKGHRPGALATTEVSDAPLI
jgi:Mrp family chromosome partitioning ATPase